MPFEISKTGSPSFVPFLRGFAILSALLMAPMASGQSRVYVSGAWAHVITPPLDFRYANEHKYFSANIEYEKRAVGSFYLLSGLSVFNTGYRTPAETAGFSNYSDFRGLYLGVPLMARWNGRNKNLYLVDVGIVPYFLLDADLTERMEKFGTPVSFEGDITRYSQRIYFACKAQVLWLVNRFIVGGYLFLPLKGQSTLKGLDKHWGLNVHQSSYLENNGFSDFYIIGVKIGARIL